MYCHTRVEEFYHPDKYRAKLCANGLMNNCEYGEFCSFAHSEQEITFDLIDKFEKDQDFYFFHFKTVWCPYPTCELSPNDCVYAHSW